MLPEELHEDLLGGILGGRAVPEQAKAPAIDDRAEFPVQAGDLGPLCSLVSAGMRPIHILARAN